LKIQFKKKEEEEANRSDPPLPRPSKNKQGAKKQNWKIQRKKKKKQTGQPVNAHFPSPHKASKGIRTKLKSKALTIRFIK
jgi:hypothetical protein